MWIRRVPFIALLVVFAILCLIYAWATPPLEASDELWHVGMIQQIAETGQLPVQAVGFETAWEQEGSQPPLYYLIAAALVSPIDRSDFDAVTAPYPHVMAGNPAVTGNKNLVLRDSPHPTPTGTLLAVYVARLFSIALGCVTVAAVYAAARVIAGELFSEGDSRHNLLPLLAAGLTAFNPMFLFITASANNDNLVTALVSLIVWQMLVLLRDGFSFRRSAVIALLIALASLAKLSGLILVPVVGLAALFVARRDRNGRGLLQLAALMAGVWLVLAGWWYVRNLNLYGELFGTGTMAAVAGVREEPFTLTILLNEFQGFRFSYWGVFGAFNILTFRWFYDVMDLVTIAAVIGLTVFLWRSGAMPEPHPLTPSPLHGEGEQNTRFLPLSTQWRGGRGVRLVPLLLLALTVLLGLVGVIAWTALTYASQGRLLFPYTAAISLLLALGLLELLVRLGEVVHWLSLPLIPLAGLALFALIVPFANIAPQYAPPAPLAELPGSIQRVYARYGDVALIGYETPLARYGPGDSVPVTLYWQVLETSDRDYSLYLHAVTDDGGEVGKVDSYPGGGRLRTSIWEAGAIYPDVYAVPLSDQADVVSALRLQVGWWDYAADEQIDGRDENGQLITAVMLNAGAFAPAHVEQSADGLTDIPAVNFGGVIALTGSRLDGDRLILSWEALGAPAADYTVFAQVLDESNAVVGQGDAPPVLPTRYWRSGERFITEHTLVYSAPQPNGDTHLIVGWYNPVDFARLDTDAPDDAYPLATLVQ